MLKSIFGFATSTNPERNQIGDLTGEVNCCLVKAHSQRETEMLTKTVVGTALASSEVSKRLPALEAAQKFIQANRREIEAR
jgi:hypothetical protein